ncbi:MAG TPA: CHAT domain-containing tetratricopeptide repeat protein [Pirellulales bacterium]|jgi:CHAT domain-containing protein/tetratricopeptide (TPR) repeat protein|nr:CHAT domain-containing tetratricopeptide repeat protein [Pirellulales bacterium]
MTHSFRLAVASVIALTAGFASVPRWACAQSAAEQQIEDLNNQVVALTDQGQFDKALGVAKRAYAAAHQSLGDQHIDTATALNNLGYCYQELGDYKSAKTYYEQALAIRKVALGPKHPHVAISLNNLGYLYDQLGEYAKAKTYFEQAVALRTEVLGLKNADTALSIGNLANVLAELGDPKGAKPLYDKALAIYQELEGPRSRNVALQLNNIGVLLFEVGDYAGAKKYYEQALAIRVEVLGAKHPDTAVSYNNVGSIYDNLGNYAAAKPYYEKALAINKEVHGLKHAATALTLNNIGTVLENQNDFAAALPYFEQALAIRKEVLGPKHPDTIVSLSNVATDLQFQKKYEAAIRVYLEALASSKEVNGLQNRTTATIESNLGAVYRLAGDPAASKPHSEQAVALRREILGPNHPDTAFSRIRLMLTDAQLGDWPHAAAEALAARQATRLHVKNVLPVLSQQQQVEFIEHADADDYRRALSLIEFRKDYQPFVPLTAEFLANGKAVIQETLAEKAAQALGVTDPRTKALVVDLNAIRSQLANLIQSAGGKETVPREQIGKLEERERQLSTRVNTNLGRTVQSEWVTLKNVRQAIPAGGMLVDIARFEAYAIAIGDKAERWQPAHYIAWLTPSAGEGEVQVFDLGPADAIDAAVTAFQVAFKPCQDPDQEKNPLLKLGEPAAEKQLRTALAGVGKLVLAPLSKALAEKTELILSPDAALWLVPWSALPIEDDKYAIEKWSIHYVTSARDLVTQQQKLSNNPPRIFANPDYDLDGQHQLASLNNILNGIGAPTLPAEQKAGLSSQLALRSVEHIGRVPRLPNTETEAEGIATSLKKLTQTEPRLYLREQALEGIFKRIRAPRVLILSTHGFFLPDQTVAGNASAADLQTQQKVKKAATDKDGKAVENPLLRCGLLLAGCNTRDTLPKDTSLDDGILTGMEIVGTDLRGTELVVLSACETGLGQVNNGEGVAGLRQAFQLAGAHSVVSTLWQIPDRQSAVLMNDFFGELARNHSKSDALRNAQLALIKSRRDKTGAAHPFYWAAFTLTGE